MYLWFELTQFYHLVIMPNMKMNKINKARFEARANVLKAMAHPTRLFMLEELAKRPHCVNELTGMVEVDVSTVSKHLSILKNTGLIYDEKRGKQVFYSLRMRCALNFLDCVEAVLKEQARDRAAVIN
jgi:DNA-binding transcriptional ArsR family regulator